ncbi:MAG: hypothetical protein R2795_17700 [Saprospiraceae bacterium]
MKKRLLLTTFCATLAWGFLASQSINVLTHRTYDGSYSNLVQPSFGQAHTPLRQFTTLGFADGFAI